MLSNISCVSNNKQVTETLLAVVPHTTNFTDLHIHICRHISLLWFCVLACIFYVSRELKLVFNQGQTCIFSHSGCKAKRCSLCQDKYRLFSQFLCAMIIEKYMCPGFSSHHSISNFKMRGVVSKCSAAQLHNQCCKGMDMKEGYVGQLSLKSYHKNK